MTRGRSPPTPEQLALEEQSDDNMIDFFSAELAHYHETGMWPPRFTKTDKRALIHVGALERVGPSALMLTPKALIMLLATHK